MARIGTPLEEAELLKNIELFLSPLPGHAHRFGDLRRREWLPGQRHRAQHLPARTGQIEGLNQLIPFFQQSAIHTKDREHDLGQNHRFGLRYVCHGDYLNESLNAPAV